MSSRKRKVSLRFRVGKVSVYLHHGAWWFYYRDGGTPVRRKVADNRQEAELPDGLAAQHPYNVVAEAMRQAGTWALGRVVFASQRSLVLVRPTGRCLVLDVLHYPAQLRTAPNWAAQLPTGLATPAELRLAQQLIDAASGPLDWSCYRDSSAEELAALVETKIAQRTPSSAAADEPTAVVQLLDALKQSVAATLAAQNGNPAAPTPSRQSPTARRQQS